MSRDGVDVDAVFDELKRELRVTPSPDFEHRVRIRTVDRFVRSSGRVVRRVDRVLVGLVCAATLAAVIGGTGTTTWIRHASTAMPSIAGTVQADAGGQHPVPSAPISIAVGAPGQSTASATAPASPVVAASGVAFEVLVPSDQAIALRRLLTAMASRHTVIPAGTTMTDAETGELLEPELIGIIRLPDIAPLGKHDDERGRERR